MSRIKRVTIHDVANEAGYSITVVSHALNDNPRINKVTREKIKAVAEKLGYRPNVFARSFALQRSELIGVVVPDIIVSFFPEIIRGIKDRALRDGYDLILATSDGQEEKERSAIQFLKQRQVDGLLIAPCHGEKNRECYQRLVRENFPLVFMDRFLPGLNVASVVTDNIEGGYLATKYLLELGHRRIGFACTDFTGSTTAERIEGYVRALKECGLPREEDLIKTSPYNSGGDVYRVDTDVIKSYLEMKNRPTAIFAVNDTMAVGVMKVLRDLGVKVPEEMSLIGYDNLAISKYLPVTLTTVSQPELEIGKTAAEILLENIKTGNGIIKQTRFKPELIVRDSCRAIVPAA